MGATLGSILLGLILALAIIGGATLIQDYIFTPTTTASSLTVGVGTGILAAQITDPPHLPSGVSDVYVSYSPIMVHAAGVALDSGWYTITNSTTLDLTRIVSQSTTLGSAKVTSGTFDYANLLITGVQITFQGVNYSASVVSRVITVPISNGGAIVQTNSSSGIVIDFSPTIFKFQGTRGSSFSMAASARSIPIPRADWNPSLDHPGASENIASTSWGISVMGLQKQSSIAISFATLQNNSLSLTVKNTGATEVNLTSLNLLFAGMFVGYVPNMRFATSVNSTSILTTTSSFSNSTANYSSNSTSSNSNSSASFSTSTTDSNSSTTVSSSSSDSNTSSTSSVSTTTSTFLTNSTDSTTWYYSTTVSTTFVTSTAISTSSHLASSNTIQTGLEPLAEFSILPSGNLVQSNNLATSGGFALMPGQSVTLIFHGQARLLPNIFGSVSPLIVHSGETYDFTILTDTGAIATYQYTVP